MDAVLRVELIDCILGALCDLICSITIPLLDIRTVLIVSRPGASHLPNRYIRSGLRFLDAAFIRDWFWITPLLIRTSIIIFLDFLFIALEATEAIADEGAEGGHAGIRVLTTTPILRQLRHTNLLRPTVYFRHLLLRYVRRGAVDGLLRLMVACFF